MNTTQKTARTLEDVKIKLYKANRRANLAIGIFFVAFDLIFLGLTLFLWSFSAYETFWGIAYLVFTALIVWYARRWPKQEA